MPTPEPLPEGLIPERELHPEHEESILLRDAMIAGLAGAASDLAQVGRELYKATVLSKVQRVVLYTTLAVVTVLLAGLFVVAVGNKANGDAIRDCTQPGGVCFERGQKSQADAIKILINQSEAAAFCSPRTATPTTYKACIAGYVRGASAGGTK